MRDAVAEQLPSIALELVEDQLVLSRHTLTLRSTRTLRQRAFSPPPRAGYLDRQAS